MNIFDYLMRFAQGGPAPMEPDLLATQQGAQALSGQTVRPNVLPFTADAQTGQMQLAMPIALDVAGNMLGGIVPRAAKAGLAAKALTGSEAALAEVARMNEVTAQAYKPKTLMDEWKAGQSSFSPEDMATLVADSWVDSGKMPPKAGQGKDPSIATDFPFLNQLSELAASTPLSPNIEAALNAPVAPPSTNPLWAGVPSYEIPYFKTMLNDKFAIGPGDKSLLEQWGATDLLKRFEDAELVNKVPDYNDPAVFGHPPQAQMSVNEFLALPPEKQNIEMLDPWQQSLVQLGEKGWETVPTSLEQKPMTAEAAADLWMTQNPQGPTKPATEYIAPPEWANRKASRMFYEGDVQGPPLPQRELDPATRLQRAVEMGFNTDQVLYTGVPTWGEVKPVGFKDPLAREGKAERAVFLSDNPDIARTYLGENVAGPGYSGGMLPVFAKMDNPLELNWRKVTGQGQYNNEMMTELIESAISQGHDSMILRGMRDQGGLQDQYLVFNPNQLRSIFAKFDPKNIHANDLTAAIAAMFGLGALTQDGSKTTP